ncbi:hypothetical protein KI387_011608, partial [Taxus chinensis]
GIPESNHGHYLWGCHGSHYLHGYLIQWDPVPEPTLSPVLVLEPDLALESMPMPVVGPAG